MEKNIFIFDQNKCVACHACVVACINENGFQEPSQWRNVHKSQESHFPDLPLFYLSIACNHCDDAPCLKNCPANAYSRDEKTGAVIHHPEKCIGCKYCTWACPYDAPKFNPKQGVIEKCTFCNHRIEDDLKPACAHLCPVGALDFTTKEFSKEDSKLSTPVPVDVGSKIEIRKLRNSQPKIDQELFKNQPKEIEPPKRHPKISAIEEWPLLIFTLLCTLLVSFFASGRTDIFTFTHKIIYLAIAAIAAVLSTLHLGKKQRAWRSLLNIRNSWLSKEILLFSLFFAAVFLDFFILHIPDIVITLLGVLLLLDIDMLYYLATWRWPLKVHSAQTLFIGITIYALLTANMYLLAFITGFRLTIFLYKSIQYKKLGLRTFIRILLLLSSFGLFAASEHIILILTLAGLGEIIDRIEFYNELNVPEPGKEIQIH